MKKENIAKILHDARLQAGFTQEELADKLNVSRKTIQNWESGIGSPSLLLALNMFSVLGLQPLPHFMNMINGGNPKKSVEVELMSVVKELPADTQEKLLFCIGAEHGSSAVGIVEMLTAYLCLPLEYRLNFCAMILHQYELLKQTRRTSENMIPNTDYLRTSIYSATAAVIEGRKEYNNIGDER